MPGSACGGSTGVGGARTFIHDPAVSLAGGLLGAGVWIAGGRALVRYPVRRRLVMGIVVLFVVFVDWGFLGIVLPRIPEGGSIYFGTSRSAYAMLQPVLIAGGLAGTGLVLWDLFFRRP